MSITLLFHMGLWIHVRVEQSLITFEYYSIVDVFPWIVIIRLTTKLNPKEDYVMKCHTEAGNILTNLKGKIDLALPELSATKIVMWNCHVDESAKGIYYMILGRDLWKALELNLKFCYHLIEADDGTSKRVDRNHGWFGYILI